MNDPAAPEMVPFFFAQAKAWRNQELLHRVLTRT